MSDATTPAEQARALLASLPEGATVGPWSHKHPAMSDRVTAEPDADGYTVVCTQPAGRRGAWGKNAALLAASPSLRDHLTAALDREARLRALLAECAMAVGDVQMSDADIHDLDLRIKAALASGDSDAR